MLEFSCHHKGKVCLRMRPEQRRAQRQREREREGVPGVIRAYVVKWA